MTDFSHLPSIQTGIWYIDGTDILYRYYCKILTFFANDSHSVTVVNSLVVSLSLYFLVDGQSQDRWLSIFLFVTLGFFQLSMNLAPFFMAIQIVMCGFRYIRSRELLKYLLFIAIGFIFHPTTVIMIPLYFLVRIKMTGKRFVAILVIGTIVTLFFYPQLLNALSKIVPARYVQYLQGASLTFDKIMVWSTHLTIFFVCWLAQKDRSSMFKDYQFAVWVFLIESLVYLLSTQSVGFSRIAFMFSPYFIIVVPELLQTSKCRLPETRYGKRQKLDIRFLAINHNAYKSAIVLFCVAQYIGRMMVNNIGTTMPYVFYF